MRIESLRYTERFGSVRINDLQKVLELDSGKKCETPRKEEIAVHKIEDEVIKDIEGRMAIVVTIKDEKLKLFEGVVSGIPHDCLIIVVSNSQRRRVDRFRMERDTLAQSPYAMVRVLWHYKPKISRGMYFRKWGRVSEITNKYMNALISEKTANAGEHTMTIKLAEILPYASGYAVEPQELISIFEGFGGILPTAHQAAAKQGIEIFQIETKNPHLHEDRGRMH